MSKDIPSSKEMQAFWRSRAAALEEARRRDELGDAHEAHRDGAAPQTLGGAAAYPQRCEICLAVRQSCHRRRAGEFTCDSCNRLKHMGRLPRKIHLGSGELARLRIQLGVTQLDFAIAMGVQQPTLSRMESRGSCRTVNAIRAAQVLEALSPKIHHPMRYLLLVAADLAPYLL